MEHDDDITLWQAYRRGDRDALGALAERYYRTLLRYGLKFGVDRDVVEDSIQSIFLRLWQNRIRISHTPSVKSYLLKSLRHAIMHYREYQQRFSSTELSAWEMALPDHFHADAYLVEEESFAEIVSQLERQFAALPDREREAMYLRYYKNLEVNQIADVMGVTRQSVSNFLQKALTKLRTRWMVTFNLWALILWSHLI
jgi:RNA polymerase sigma factor (sigma-70 family)